jgi:hypothetical protein
MRAMGRARSHSSNANTGQTISLSPSGNRNGLRSSMAEYGRRSLGCMSRCSSELQNQRRTIDGDILRPIAMDATIIVQIKVGRFNVSKNGG